MSHFTKMTVLAKQENEQDLIGALKAHFGDGVEVYDQAKPLKLWNGGSAAGGAYGNVKDCHIIIRKDVQNKASGRNAMTNDAGYRRNEEGTYDVYSDPAGFPKNAHDAIMRDYSERVASRKMKAQGYSMKRKVMEDGRVQLSFSKYA